MPKSLQAASKAAVSKSKAQVAAISGGVSKSDYQTEILDSIQVAIGEFIEKVVINISEKDVIDTGNITNIVAERTDTGWRILAAPYLDYQSKGVNGVGGENLDRPVVSGSPYSFKPGVENAPPPTALKDWCEKRNLNPFAVSKNLQKYGIEPKMLWEIPFEELADKVPSDVAQAILDTIKPQPTIVNKSIKL